LSFPSLGSHPFTFRSDTIDPVVFRHVFEENEYRVPDHLAPDHLIIDIGAHIGSFSYLCWLRGARKILAFEADPENAALARQNLASTNVELRQCAVWRSDLQESVTLYHSGYQEMLPDGPDPVGMNTGIGNVLAASGVSVPTQSLDDIIGDRQVRILKIDCEGSEYPILLTSQKLRQVVYLTGEYHFLPKVPPIARVRGLERYSVGLLADWLTENRFRVEFVPYQDPRFAFVGNFFAYNLDLT
jgi:FkbM family methyltransferase